MIYELITPKEDICQGDIFFNLPFDDFNLEHLKVIIDDDEVKDIAWVEISEEDVKIIVKLQKVNAIVLSQDCDCLREPYITLAVISKWENNYENPKNWMHAIRGLNRSKSKMYLPQDSNFKIEERLHIEFSRIFKLYRKSLYSLRDLRVCRLNPEAIKHFRQKLGNYFIRYAFDEYYPLNKEEMDEYETYRLKNNPDEKFERREYQK